MEGNQPLKLPNLEEIRAAQRRIQGQVHRTPLLSSRFFGELAANNIGS